MEEKLLKITWKTRKNKTRCKTDEKRPKNQKKQHTKIWDEKRMKSHENLAQTHERWKSDELSQKFDQSTCNIY